MSDVRVARILEEMLRFSAGNLHDIDHLIRVWTYARTIGELEGLDGATQFVLEVAAITHDLACPLCREKYGNTDGKNQERESAALVEHFFAGTGVPADMVDRIAWLAAHHHTYGAVDGPDHQILLEADFLVNADESAYSPAMILEAYTRMFKTAAGKRLLAAVYFPDGVPCPPQV